MPRHDATPPTPGAPGENQPNEDAPAPSRAKFAPGDQPTAGPRVRTDVVEVHIFRATAAADGSGPDWELLQLRRVEQPMAGTWQPVMGHIEVGESATAAAIRELGEEVGLRPGDTGLVGVWRLEQSVPYYIARSDAFMISPRFAVEVTAEWTPTLNDEHDAMRWIGTDQLRAHVFWPSQRAAIEELLTEIAGDGGPAKAALRVEV